MTTMADERGVKRSHNFSEEEKIVLLQFVQDHKTQLLGKAGRPGHGDDKVEERKARYWQKCADAIHQVGGERREWKKVRKQWFALKDKAKKLKGEMGQTGGGPKPEVTKAMHLCMEVMARESLEGIRGRSTEVDPTGTATPDMSQDSSQESYDALSSAQAPPPPQTTEPTTEIPSSPSLAALQQQVQQLQKQMQAQATQPSALLRDTELRQLKFQEELLKLEKTKVGLQRQALDIQKRMLAVMESFESRAMFSSMVQPES